MNYSELVAEIQSYTENQFQTADINTFIQQAEQRIYNSVQLPALRKNVTGTMTSGNKYLAMPTDWLATFSLAVINASNEYTYLLNKDVNFIRQSFPDTDSDFYGALMWPTPGKRYSKTVLMPDKVRQERKQIMYDLQEFKKVYKILIEESYAQ